MEPVYIFTMSIKQKTNSQQNKNVAKHRGKSSLSHSDNYSNTIDIINRHLNNNNNIHKQFMNRTETDGKYKTNPHMKLKTI